MFRVFYILAFISVCLLLQFWLRSNAPADNPNISQLSKSRLLDSIGEIESKLEEIELNLNSSRAWSKIDTPLKEYRRYYSTFPNGDGFKIVAAFTTVIDYPVTGSEQIFDRTNVFVVPYDHLPMIMDGGCSIIYLFATTEPKLQMKYSCNGFA